MTLQEIAAEIELSRRIVHVSGGTPLFLYLLDVITWPQFGRLLAAVVVCTLVLEYARLKQGFSHAVYDHLTRPYEDDVIAGYAVYAVGMGLAWLLFPAPAATAGMLMLALGDPIGGVLTSVDGGDSKEWSVMFAMCAACTVLGSLVTIPAVGFSEGVAAAFCGAIGATIADSYKPVIHGRIIDDNLTIPLIGSVGVTLVVFL